MFTLLDWLIPLQWFTRRRRVFGYHLRTTVLSEATVIRFHPQPQCLDSRFPRATNWDYEYYCAILFFYLPSSLLPVGLAWIIHLSFLSRDILITYPKSWNWYFNTEKKQFDLERLLALRPSYAPCQVILFQGLFRGKQFRLLLFSIVLFPKSDENYEHMNKL